MPERYRHTQPGTLMLVVMPIGAVVFATIAYMIPGPGRWGALIVAFFLLVLGWLFSSLTVVVNDSELRWYFGPRLWIYRMPLSDIASVEVVHKTASLPICARVARQHQPEAELALTKASRWFARRDKAPTTTNR
jgi:hypothetical protein